MLIACGNMARDRPARPAPDGHAAVVPRGCDSFSARARAFSVLKPRRGGPKQKHDAKYIAAARELRDRYLEEVNTGRLLPGAGTQRRYDVSRQLPPPTAARVALTGALPCAEPSPLRLLDAA